MSFPLGGDVVTSTVNNPVSSKSFLRMGVVSFQLCAFWPSTIRALIGAAAATEAMTSQICSAGAEAMQRHGSTPVSRWGGAGMPEVSTVYRMGIALYSGQPTPSRFSGVHPCQRNLAPANVRCALGRGRPAQIVAVPKKVTDRFLDLSEVMAEGHVSDRTAGGNIPRRRRRKLGLAHSREGIGRSVTQPTMVGSASRREK